VHGAEKKEFRRNRKVAFAECGAPKFAGPSSAEQSLNTPKSGPVVSLEGMLVV